MKTGICSLCQTNGDLCNSHIIPEFNYKPLYDSNHRFIRLSAKGPNHKRFDQKGYREYLLCLACETKFSQWENYAKGILHDGGLQRVTQNPFGFTFEGLDFQRFRLYGLSMLWRMSVSSLEMFSAISLGPHQERLRQTLLADDPLSPDEYPFIMAAVSINRRFQSDLIVPPSLVKSNGEHIYRVVISGLIHFFHVANHPGDEDIRDMAVTLEGRLKIPAYEMRDVPFLCDYVTEIFKATRKENAT